MPSLYRQYRPKLFAEIEGQKHITHTLQQAFRTDKVSHAYLFQGPRGTGKTTTARVFARLLNCLKPEVAEPCGDCALCVATLAGRNLDIIEIDAASNRGIDDIRSLRETIGLSPGMGSTKIYIIDEVHMLTKEAFAALLKTLEEPVSKVVFILATTELHKVPDTILSRCQVFRFRRATENDMRARLKHLLTKEQREIDEKVIDFVIGRSEGCYRDAESLLGQLLTFQEGQVSMSDIAEYLGIPDPNQISDFIKLILSGSVTVALQQAHQMYQEGFDPEQLVVEVLRSARDGWVAGISGQGTVPEFAREDQLAQRLPALMRAFIQAQQDMAFVPQPLMALQLAIFTVAGTSPQPPKPVHELTTIPKKAAPQSVAVQDLPKKPRPSQVVTPPAQPVEEIFSLWPAVVTKLKAVNPVGSTFLRAVTPTAWDGAALTMSMQFPLHKTFFEKADNKERLEKILSEILNTPVMTRCQIQQSSSPQVSTEEAQKQEAALLKNVREVFGIQEPS